MRKIKGSSSGFTLIELLVVIAIIIILAAGLGAAVIGMLKRAEQARAEANITAIESAIKQYQADYKALPPIAVYSPPTARETNADLKFILESEALIGVVPVQWSAGPYITNGGGIDVELFDGGGSTNPDGTPKTVFLDPWGNAYQIRFPGLDHTTAAIPGKNNVNFVDIFSLGPNGVEDTTTAEDDDICNYRFKTK